MISSIYWGIAIFVLAFWVRAEPGDSRYFKTIMFFYAAFGSMFLPKTRESIYISVFTGIAFIWIFLFPMAHTGVAWKSIVVLASVLLFSKLYTSKDSFDVDILKDLLALACIGQAIWIFINYLGFDPAGWFGIMRRMAGGDSISRINMRVAGSLDNIMVSANFLALTFPFLIRRDWVLFIPCVLVVVVISESATGILGIGISIAAYLFYSKEYRALATYLILGAVAAFVLYDPRFMSPGSRTQVWVESLGIWFKSGLSSQLFGFGPGIFKHFIRKLLSTKEVFSHPHNEYISILFQFGIVGLGIFLGGIWKALRGKDPHFQSALCVLLLTMMSAFPLHIASTGVISILILVFCIDFQSDRMLKY